jgi:hypothetical protein
MPDIVELGKILELLASLLISGENILEQSLSAIDLGIDELLINLLVSLIGLLCGLLALHVSESISVLETGIFSHLLIDQGVVEILQVFENLNRIQSIILLVLTGVVEWVIRHLEHLELVLQALEILHSVVMLSNQVLAE